MQRFFGALVAVDGVLKRFRTGYLGKVSPVHFFWESFELAFMRFSGAAAPFHPGGIPALPDEVRMRSPARLTATKCLQQASGRAAG
ncbi:DUF5996 family protein [Azospirillum canadense]|uniref:DUF5996 family protein n=1 Tax=Azospirillum canadense TaxID=403962 RepID=UPI003872C9EE